jgi:hypothetical protein
VDACAPFIETLLSMLLTLPSPRHRFVYYANLLLDLSRLITSAPQASDRALHILVIGKHTPTEPTLSSLSPPSSFTPPPHLLRQPAARSLALNYISTTGESLPSIVP